jgi:hypothetical protein
VAQCVVALGCRPGPARVRGADGGRRGGPKQAAASAEACPPRRLSKREARSAKRRAQSALAVGGRRQAALCPLASST